MKRCFVLAAVAILAYGALAVGDLVDDTPAQHLASEWRAVLDGLSEEQRVALESGTPTERAQRAQQLLAEQRRREDAAFLELLDEAQRERYAATPLDARPRLLLEMRIDAKLERALEECRSLGLIDAPAAAAARALPAGALRAERILELQKAQFLALESERLERLPAALRAELLALPPRLFFRHGAVRGLRLRAVFTASGWAEIRYAGREVIRDLGRALAEGEVDAAPLGLLREVERDALLARPVEERRRFVADLERYLSRVRRAEATGEREGGDERLRARPLVPPAVWRELAPEERAALVHAGPEAHRNFLERRSAQGAAASGQRLHLSTRDFLEAWRSLDADDRAELLDQPMQRAVMKVVAKLTERIESLSPEERATFEAQPERSRRAWLRARFPEVFEGR